MDIKDVQKTITDRIANPLVTAFFLGFVIVNWEIFYLSFFVSADSLQGLNKIEYVQQYFAKMPWWELNLRLYIVPALSILFFYFGPMPWLTNLVLNSINEANKKKATQAIDYEVHVSEEREKMLKQKKSELVLERSVVKEENEIQKIRKKSAMFIKEDEDRSIIIEMRDDEGNILFQSMGFESIGIAKKLIQALHNSYYNDKIFIRGQDKKKGNYFELEIASIIAGRSKYYDSKIDMERAIEGVKKVLKENNIHLEG